MARSPGLAVLSSGPRCGTRARVHLSACCCMPIGRRIRAGRLGPCRRYDLSQFVPLEVQAGALVLLHGENVHYRWAACPACLPACLPDPAATPAGVLLGWAVVGLPRLQRCPPARTHARPAACSLLGRPPHPHPRAAPRTPAASRATRTACTSWRATRRTPGRRTTGRSGRRTCPGSRCTMTQQRRRPAEAVLGAWVGCSSFAAGRV